MTALTGQGGKGDLIRKTSDPKKFSDNSDIIDWGDYKDNPKYIKDAKHLSEISEVEEDDTV